MKLLFDHQLSPQLVARIADVFPGSHHVYPLGLDRSPDASVWEYALRERYTIVSKDSDFNDLSMIRGYPPKVIWIRRGNCRTMDIEEMLRANAEVIRLFSTDSNLGVLALF